MDNTQIAIMVVAFVAAWTLKENAERKKEIARLRRELHAAMDSQNISIVTVASRVDVAHQRLDGFRELVYEASRK